MNTALAFAESFDCLGPTPLLQPQPGTFTTLKFSTREAINHGDLPKARELLQRAENQLGGEVQDTELKTLTNDLHERETAPNADTDNLPVTNNGHGIDNIFMNAGDYNAANGEWTASFSSEAVQLSSYGSSPVDSSHGLSHKAFTKVTDPAKAEKHDDPDRVQNQYDGYAKHTATAQAGHNADDVIGEAFVADMAGLLPG